MVSNKTETKKWHKSCFSDQAIDQLDEIEQKALIASVLSFLAKRHQPGETLGSTEQTRQYLCLKLADKKTEVFGCVFLDCRHRILEDCELFHGTIDGAAVYPRVVVQTALTLNAAAVVFYHNHCSGVAEPSAADEMITRRLKEALALVDVRVLDHLIVSADQSMSFAERGML